MFLVVVDAHTKWLEVIPMTTTSIEKQLRCYRLCLQVMACPRSWSLIMGLNLLPSVLKSSNGVQHLKSPSYDSATNGEAERFVQTFKHFLKARWNETETLATRLSQFLLKYCTILHATIGVCPSRAVFEMTTAHQIWFVEIVLARTCLGQIINRRRSKDRLFQISQPVLVQNFRDDQSECQAMCL